MNESSNESERKPLLELAQFVLNRNTENIRDELHNYLIEIALYNLSKPIMRKEIKNEIEKEFGFSEFPQTIVDFALDRLSGTLQIQGTPSSYMLSDKRRNELFDMLNNQKLLRDYVLARVLTAIETNYGDMSESASKEVSRCLFNFLALAFENLSAGISLIIAKGLEIEKITEVKGLNEMLKDASQEIDDKTLREDTIKVVQDLLSHPDEKVSIFLYSLAQSNTLLKILNIDPQCQSLEKDLILSNMKVYLDTNFAVSLICEKARKTVHSSCVKLLNLMSELGIKYAITVRTAKEIEEHLKTADFEYNNMGPVSDNRRMKLLKFMEDEIIREYWLSLSSSPGLRWTAFLGRLRSFSSILHNKYSVEIDKSVHDNIAMDQHFDELAKIIAEASPNKSPQLVEHDCYHMLLVESLREQIQDHDVIPKIWFLTRDRSLDLVEKVRQITEKKKPVSVYVDVWLQIITPLLSPKIAAEQGVAVFANCISSDILPSFPKISPVLLAKLVGPALDATDLEWDEVKQIVGDTYLAEHFDELGKGKVEVHLTDKLLAIREERHKREMAKASKKHREDMEKSAEEKESLVQQVEKLQKENEDLKGEVDESKHVGKYLVGGFVFIIVLLSMYYLVLLPTIHDAYISLIFSLLISLVFGYLIGLKRYDWVLEKFMNLISALTGRQK
jgi:hypothetical protein